MLLGEILESGVVTAACKGPMSEATRGTIAGQLTHLLDGRSLLKVYEPVTSDDELRSAAEAACRLVLLGEYPGLCDESIMLGTLLAVHLWYASQFSECIAVANHLLEIPGEGSAEVYRVRGFAHFALGEYEVALADILEAQRRNTGLVGINEPLKALRKLTNTSAQNDTENEPAVVGTSRMVLETFSTILHLGAAAAGGKPKQNELFDYAAMAQQADALRKSGALARRQVQVGDLIDLAKCAMSAQLALTTCLLKEERPGRGSLPPEQKIRDAFGHCMLFLSMTPAINPNMDPKFLRAVQELQREVDRLYVRLDEFKFDLR